MQVEDENTNIYGRANSHYTIHGSYSEGQIIEIKVVVDTYHWVRKQKPEIDAVDKVIMNQNDAVDRALSKKDFGTRASKLNK